MVRKLAWAALGFAAAAALAEYILPVRGLPYIAAALAVSALLSLALRRAAARKRALLLLLAAAAGMLAWWGRYVTHILPSAAKVGETVHIEAIVTDYVERHDDYERLEARLLDGGKRAERAYLYLYEGTLPDLEPGDVVEAEVRLTSAVIRRGERSHIYTSQGVDILGYITPDSLAVTGRWAHSWLYFPQRLSQNVKRLCDSLLPADAAPLVKGLLTGDTTDLEEDAENYTAMRVAGVLHIVAVSGMHLFVLTGFVQLLLGKGRRTSLFCLPVIVLFTLMAGCRPSVVRAAVMQGLYLLAPLVKREADGPTCLGAAALLLLAANPMAIGGVGLQLSFACMAGMVLLLPAMTAWMGRHLPMERRLVSFAAGNLACTLAATAFSLPLAAVYFGLIPLLSPLANLLTLPVVEAVFAAGYVLCAIGALFPSAGAFLGQLLAWPVRWCTGVYRAVAGLPFAALPAYAGTAIWLAGVYGLFTAWYILRRRGRRLPADIPGCLALMGLCAVLLAARLSLPAGSGVLAVLDVDQGESVVLAGHDAAVVVDCGGNGLDDAGDIAAGYLAQLGRSRLDALVLTHLHRDHAKGAETLLYRVRVDRLILPAGADDADGTLDGILAAAEKRGTQVILLEEPTQAVIGDISLTLLLPQAEGDENEQGIVALADIAGRRTLVMGDAGQPAELSLLRDRSVPDTDILVAGHHGSRTASGALFLTAARPETAVISVGYNTYGQPHPDTLARLERAGAAVYRTDVDGDVIIRWKEADDSGHQ